MEEIHCRNCIHSYITLERTRRCNAYKDKETKDIESCWKYFPRYEEVTG